MRRSFFFCGCVWTLGCALLCSAIPSDARESYLEDLDAYIEKTMEDWNVPGLAVAVVQGDSVVLARGYGVKSLESGERVDEHTLFGIGSCTKAFTTAALAMLFYEGKINMDAPVIDYLAGFRLYDPYVTREITVRDLVTHRSGLQTYGGDLLWFGTTYGRDEIIRRARYLKPVSSFRSRFAYQNVMYLVAGQVIQAVSGKTWDEFIEERIFDRIGMANSCTSVARIGPEDNAAIPYESLEGEIRPIPFFNLDNVAPAGSINASASDMARWLRLQLDRGVYEGERLYSEYMAGEMWTTQIEMGASGYGLGWQVEDYRGLRHIHHGGGLPGMSAEVALFPDKKLGIAVMNNMVTLVPEALTRRIVDAYCGFEPTDWSAELRKDMDQYEQMKVQGEKEVDGKRVKGTRPSFALHAYEGTYRDEMYGEAQVTEKEGRLHLQLMPAPSLQGDLEHFHYDVFQIVWDNTFVPRGLVQFEMDFYGRITALKIEVPNFPDLVFSELDFRKVADDQ